MGSPIGSAPVTVAGGDDEILTFPWMPSNPSDYASFGADQSHFCLLSRIETSSTAPFGMTTPETTNLHANVRNNNNIVWKNITVVDEVAGTGRFTAFIVANFGEKPQDLRLVFTVSDDGPTVLDWGRVFIDVPYPLAMRLEGRPGRGFERLSETTFLLTSNHATLGGAELQPGDVYGLTVRFAGHGDQTIGARVLTLDVQQYNGKELLGGVRFAVRTRPGAVDWAGCEQGAPLDGANWITGTGQAACHLVTAMNGRPYVQTPRRG